jgi:ABC-type nitrate/sulfonate/bicarbonate transport system substrate-binding protein
MQPGGEFFLNAIAAKNGVDASQIKTKIVGATLEPLLVGQIDYFTGLVNQTFQIEQEAAKPDAAPNIKGKTWQALIFSDWAVRQYHDVVFAQKKTLTENPDLARRFMRALARGLQFTIDQPAEAVKLTEKYAGQIEDAEKLNWRTRVQNPLFQSEATKQQGLFAMDTAVWEGMIQFFADSGQIPRTIPASEAMTLDFLPGPTPRP